MLKPAHRRLLLHIGSPKTGSSAIQEALYPHRFRRRHRWWPPLTPPWLVVPPNPFRAPKPSGFIAALYLPFDELPRYLRLRYQSPTQLAADQRLYRRLLARVLACTPQAVLSSEYLFRFNADQIARLRDDLHSWGVDEVRVLLYVRAPELAYGSFLQQWLKLSTDLSPYHPHSWYYDFRGSLERWEAAFPGAVVVRSYDGCVLTDFSEQMQDFLPASAPLTPSRGPQANTGLSRESLYALQQVLPHLAGTDPQRRFPQALALASLRHDLEAAAQHLPGGARPVRVWPAVAALLRQRHGADLDWLESRYGVTFAPPAESALARDDDPSLQRPLPQAGVDCRLEELLEPPSMDQVHALLAATLASRLVDPAVSVERSSP